MGSSKPNEKARTEGVKYIGDINWVAVVPFYMGQPSFINDEPWNPPLGVGMDKSEIFANPTGEQMLKIKFIESHSFVGAHMSMDVNGVSTLLEMKPTYKQHAISVLKDVYDIHIEEDDFVFKWDGTL